MRLKALLFCLIFLTTLCGAAGESEIDPAPSSTESPTPSEAPAPPEVPAPPAVPAPPTMLAPLSAAPLEQSPPIPLNCAAAMLVEQDSGQVV
ncbi:MAG: hypothetical protein IKE76_10730, partial [Clostridia bacterium]|nr:hypothetical protein [Clostridia bacterium]